MKPPVPPRFAEWLLERLIPGEELFEKAGDLEERFWDRVRDNGCVGARLWYSGQVLRLILFHLKDAAIWSCIMLKNYIKIALRNIRRNGGYSFINIAGLALGMASCILILAWVRDERGFDRFHEKTDSLYLVRTINHYGSETTTGTGSVPALGPALKAEYPEVRAAARINNGQRRVLVEAGTRPFREPIQMADPELFEVMTFPFVRGSVRDAFAGPNVMVLSQSAAARIFGREDPLGQTVRIDKADEFRVVGVMKDIPFNSSIRFDIWVPLEMSLKWNRPNYTKTWTNQAFRTYVVLTPGVNLSAFNAKIFNRIRRSDPRTILEPQLYPFKDVYLKVWGREENVRLFSIIAFLILVIACINFMNLTTARSTRRAKEIGLRKVVGAYRRQVMRQFFGEALIFTLLAVVLSLALIALVLPAFRALTAKGIQLADFFRPGLLAGMAGITLLTGLLAGSYPALWLSAFKPAGVLKGLRDAGRSGRLFRKILVIAQFSLSIVLIIGTTVIRNQVGFMKDKSLGFDREHLLYIPLEGALPNSIAAFKQEILRFPGIRSASAATHSPTGIYSNGSGWNWPGRNPNVDPLVTIFGVDPDFLETFGMTMAQGQTFRLNASPIPQVIINERFAEIIGSPNAVGMALTSGVQSLEILGVVKNYHFKPVTAEIEPIIMFYDPTYRRIEAYRYMFIRLNPGDVRAAIAFLERTVRKFNPEYPFDYRFLDEDYDLLYRNVEREMAIVGTFAGLAIFISCLGLFGLAAYMAEQRTKEIGIRKVLGASVRSIAAMLSKEFAKWVLIANAVAWPVAYVLMKGWLKEYPYQTPLSLSIFLVAAAAALAIAQLTVIAQALKAANTSPVLSIRRDQ